jgi:membrane protease YdiL (CAAX protease family)
MRPLLRRFLIKLTIVTLVMVFLSIIVFLTFLRPYYFVFYPVLFVFILGVTLLTYAFLNKRARQDFGKFIRATMVVTVLRLLVYITVTVLYAVIIKEKLVEFVIALGIFYLIFTSLEVYDLIVWSGKIKTENKKI